MSINGKKVFTEADVIAALRLAKANKVTEIEIVFGYERRLPAKEQKKVDRELERHGGHFVPQDRETQANYFMGSIG